MRRWIATHHYVQGDPEVLKRTLLADSHELLLRATRTPASEAVVDGSFIIDVPASFAGRDLGKHVRAHTGVARHVGTRVILPLRWQAEPGRPLFPAFDGSIELEQVDRARSELSLFGSYRLPLGPVGAAAEATLFRNIAMTTADTLMKNLAAELAETVRGGPVAEVPSPRHGAPLRVSDVMTSEPLLLDPDMSLRTAALLLFHMEISGAPVVAPTGELLGVLSERDLLAKEAHTRTGRGRAARTEQRRLEARTVAEACTSPARTTVPEALLADAALEMMEHDVSRLVVVDDAAVAGIVTRHDILAALVREDRVLQHAVHTILEGYNEPGVLAEVQWGEAYLAGSVSRRSVAEHLIDAVEHVDGIMAVDATALDWLEDDLTVPIVPFA
jgi:CBS domain-containing protein